MKVRVFRPFPGKEMAEALKDCKAVGIFDRCESYSANGGPLGAELMAAMYRNKNQAETVNYIYGLSGRDLTVEQVEETFDELMQTAEEGTGRKCIPLYRTSGQDGGLNRWKQNLILKKYRKEKTAWHRDIVCAPDVVEPLP